MKTLSGLGWHWCENGVVLCVKLDDGQPMCVFVPLNRVWHEFHKELGAVGAPLQAYVGEEISVSGLFSGISHALSRAGHAATHAISRAASGVARTATNYAEHAAKFAKGAVENKYFRDAVDVAAFAVPALAPAAAAMEVANKAMATYHEGMHAAALIKQGVTSAANTAKVAAGLAAKGAVADIIAKAKQGDTRAKQIVGALQAHHAVASAPPAQRRPPQLHAAARRTGGHSFRPRYHTQPATVSGPYVGGGYVGGGYVGGIGLFQQFQNLAKHHAHHGGHHHSFMHRPHSPFGLSAGPRRAH